LLSTTHQKYQSLLMLKPKKKNPAAVALSKLGASKGGIARAKKLSPKERSRIAKLAVEARWAKYHGDK
jgi:ABC-type phosphate/phosphonate transport system ATPase subunit